MKMYAIKLNLTGYQTQMWEQYAIHGLQWLMVIVIFGNQEFLSKHPVRCDKILITVISHEFSKLILHKEGGFIKTYFYCMYLKIVK